MRTRKEVLADLNAAAQRVAALELERRDAPPKVAWWRRPRPLTEPPTLRRSSVEAW